MSDKKEAMEGKESHHRGLLGWSFGMLGMIFAVMQPIAGIIFSIISLIISVKQNKSNKTEWSKVGKILGIFGLILSIAVMVLGFLALKYISANSDLLAQLQAGT